MEILITILFMSPVALFIVAIIAIEVSSSKSRKQRREDAQAVHNFYKAHGEVMPPCLFDYYSGGHLYSPREVQREMYYIGQRLRNEGKLIDDYAGTA